MRSGTATAWRAVQWIVGVVVIGLAIRSLVRNWSELRHQTIVLEFRPLHLVGSLVLVWVVYALLIAAWRQMLTGWGQRLDPWGAARIWTVSNLGKYVPGKVWALAGMAFMAQRAAVWA